MRGLLGTCQIENQDIVIGKGESRQKKPRLQAVQKLKLQVF